MSKYSYEFKKKIVLEYLAGEGGPVTLARKYGIPSETRIKEWIKAYQNLGDEGLMRSRQKKNYSYEYKLGIVEMYLTSELSYMDIALAEKIKNPCIIAQWVSDFRAFGPEALRPKKKGRKAKVDTPETQKIKPIEETVPVDTSVEHVKELEDELLKLRIENAFLKELRRLRLEEEALLKKQRESFTASEEPSN
jgi:transposase